MACPICERVYCDHTPQERGQTYEEMMADCYGLTVEEFKKGVNPLEKLEKKKEARVKKGRMRRSKKKQ